MKKLVENMNLYETLPFKLQRNINIYLQVKKPFMREKRHFRVYPTMPQFVIQNDKKTMCEIIISINNK